MLAAPGVTRQARRHDRYRLPGARARFHGLALLPGRARRQLLGPAPLSTRSTAASGPDRIGHGVLQPSAAHPAGHGRAVAVAMDPVAARAGSRLRARVIAPPAPIECAARMAHSAAPTQKLKGNEWRVVGTLIPYLLEYKGRVALALACLIVAKLANVGVPLVMKEVVDRLEGAVAIVAVPVALLATYGILRFSTTMFGELRDVLFVPVTQRAIRRLALGVFRHLHSLSLRFHLARQTGRLKRDNERGTRGISTLLSSLVFSILPVILEFSLVAVVL